VDPAATRAASPATTPAGLAGVVLAAGAGTRLRPLTLLRPKALCPVGGRALVDLALDRLAPLSGSGTRHLAVNAHHLAAQLSAHCSHRAHVSVEPDRARGTAGALGLLRGWIDGRDVAVVNADAYLPTGLDTLAEGWDRRRCRLLCRPVRGAERADFAIVDGPGLRYVGACLLPARLVARLPATPAGLYEVLWRTEEAAGRLDLAVTAGVAIDCGTPADYLEANLHASGGASVIGAGAVVEGRVDRCVVWDGAWVGPREHLVEAIRAGTRRSAVTVDAHRPRRTGTVRGRERSVT
jgi:NDP-sugar pyrophosphorylase family protein